VVRGEFIDERLRHLIASVTTALDEYRRLVADETADEVQPEAGISAPGEIIDGAVTQSMRLETDLDDAVSEVAATTISSSRAADDLKRQISDGQGLNRLARAELRMPRVVVGWYRWIVEALKDYPALISNTADSLKLGVDIAEIALDRWHEFHRNKWAFILEEIKKTCDALGSVGEKLEERKRRRPGRSLGSEEVFNDEIARAMILAGRTPPAHWISSITSLEFGTRRLRDLTPLAGLTNLQSLTHIAARVNDLSPLAGLRSLESLDISGTRVRDLAPLAALANLKRLTVTSTFVADLNPLVTLTKLEMLSASNSRVGNISPLSGLISLRDLYLRSTPIRNVSPLAGLTNLRHLDLASARVSDTLPLAGLTNLETLDLGDTPVGDLSPLGGLTNLKFLNLERTQISDVTPLAQASKLRHLRIVGTNVLDLSPLTQLTRLEILELDARGVDDLLPLAAIASLRQLRIRSSYERDDAKNLRTQLSRPGLSISITV
jgi:Leucine-rich repeat (LRR) protein